MDCKFFIQPLIAGRKFASFYLEIYFKQTTGTRFDEALNCLSWIFQESVTLEFFTSCKNDAIKYFRVLDSIHKIGDETAQNEIEWDNCKH